MTWLCARCPSAVDGIDRSVGHGAFIGDGGDACRSGYRHLAETYAMPLQDDAFLLDDGQCRLAETKCRDVAGASARELVVAGIEITRETFVAHGERHHLAPVTIKQLYVVVVFEFLGIGEHQTHVAALSLKQRGGNGKLQSVSPVEQGIALTECAESLISIRKNGNGYRCRPLRIWNDDRLDDENAVVLDAKWHLKIV